MAYTYMYIIIIILHTLSLYYLIQKKDQYMCETSAIISSVGPLAVIQCSGVYIIL